MVKSMISSRHCILALLCTAICLASCSKQALPEEPAVPDKPAPEVVAETVEYHISAACAETKTAISGASVVWSAGDKLTVAYQHEDALQTAVFEYEGNNSFKGEVAVPDDPCDWYAIYPSSASATSGLSINLPSEAVQQGNGSKAHLAGEAFPLLGSALEVSGSDVPHMQMEQLAAVVNFNVTNQEDSPIKVSKVIFSAPVEIAGEFSGDITADNSWNPVTGKATKTAVLNVTGGEEIASGASASFYMGMMPFNATGDFTITVMAECGGEQIYSTKNVQNKTMEFKAGVIGKINYKFVSNVPEEEKDYYVKVTTNPGAKNWSGTYLIVNTADNMALKALNGSLGANGVTVLENKIEATSEIDRYAMTVSGGTSTHSKGSNGAYAYDFRNSDGQYVYFNSNGLQFSSSNSGNGGKYQYAITLDGNTIQLMCGKNGGSGGSKYYLTYSGNGFNFDNTEGNRVLLYRKVEAEDTRTVQTLEFAESRVTWYIGEEADHQVGATYNLPQQVSGAQTFVTYTSSDPEVAEIVGNSQIKVNDIGKVTITATAVESDSFKEANASYTLTIREPGSATEIDLGDFDLDNSYIKKYLLEAADKYADDGSGWSTYTIVTNYTAGSSTNSFDRPNPVYIPVDEADGSKVTVEIYNDAQRTDEELIREYTVSNGYAEVYNLIPNDDYWYNVIAGGEELSRGTFTTSGLRRYLTVSNIRSNDHANNLRDFGGQKTEDGHTLRYNLIFRGTNMDKTTSEEQDWIINYMNVRRDVDLRAKSSYSSTSYANRPLPEIVEYTNGNISNWEDITNAKMQDIFSGIAKTVSAGDACYIHCYVGADRTGYISILINAICGVSEKDCTIDFELTSFSCVGRRNRNMTTYGYNNKGLLLIESKAGDTFQQKAINTLLGYGVPQSDIDAIITAMVE